MARRLWVLEEGQESALNQNVVKEFPIRGASREQRVQAVS